MCIELLKKIKNKNLKSLQIQKCTYPSQFSVISFGSFFLKFLPFFHLVWEKSHLLFTLQAEATFWLCELLCKK